MPSAPSTVTPSLGCFLLRGALPGWRFARALLFLFSMIFRLPKDGSLSFYSFCGVCAAVILRRAAVVVLYTALLVYHISGRAISAPQRIIKAILSILPFRTQRGDDMRAKQIAVLAAVPLAIFTVTVGLFLLLAQPGSAEAAEPPAYLLGAQGGKVVLFKSGEDTPVARYEIYLSLLPEADADALRRGIPVATREELNRYLEDFGA